ncbi:uncharacterized protein LOC120088964 [Benincasa hispida]|uniref:uncharacterized protein LOC120088964 n=1 Tax=Benincasa hispida TaxID=102211 RepID=UPI0018FFE4B9|nr:uncharacterized protein LOC120088964 [Benincasa hispida]
MSESESPEAEASRLVVALKHTRVEMGACVYGLHREATIGTSLFKTLYGRNCRSPICWDEVGEKKLLGPELSRQKSYTDVRCKDLKFEIGDNVFLKVAPIKGVLRFGRKWKLSPRFIGPFKILEQIGPVAYRLALPPSLTSVHNVFRVSMLSVYVTNPSHVVDFEPLQLNENLSYEEKPVRILAKVVKTLLNKEIVLVKILWQNHQFEEAIWEREDEMKAQYLKLFQE